MTARMDCFKDHQTFFETARSLSSESGWLFCAAGSGPKREEYQKSTKDLMEKGVVEFPDSGMEVLPWVAQSDIGVLLSNPEVHAEGCSNSIMEYMACGLPVICSEGGGNSELVVDGVTGFIIPTKNSAALEKKLRLLKNNPGLAIELGNNGKKRLMEKYSTEKMVRETVSVYEKL